MQLQLLVPFLNTDATFTANMKREDELEMELKSDIKVMSAVSKQKIQVKYGNTLILVFIFCFRLLFLGFVGFVISARGVFLVELKKNSKLLVCEDFVNIFPKYLML